MNRNAPLPAVKEPDRVTHSFLTARAVNSLVVPPTASARRRTRRSEAEEGPGFRAQFDDRTLIYDGYVSRMSGRIELLGPPTDGLERAVAGMSCTGSPGAPHVVPRRQVQRWVFDAAPGPGEGGAVAVDLHGSGRTVFPVAPVATMFDGRRVLLTMFRYEPLDWLADWARYHVRVHGADAVLVYCNTVRHATMAEVSARLRDVAGLAVSHVVAWDFPYGPVGRDAGPRPWEDVFAKPAMYEHALTRYLAAARGVINADIDELVVTDDGASVYDILDTHDGYGLVFWSRMIAADTDGFAADPADRRHRDFDRFITATPEPSRTSKWIVAPARGTGPEQWMTHTVPDARITRLRDRVWFAHLSPLNVGWKNAVRDTRAARGGRAQALADAYRRAGW